MRTLCAMHDPHRIAELLDRWLRETGRVLEVRAARDPWQVLVVEVMSQQTRIERVGPYWRAFIERWPTPAALATAPTADLLRAWAGLGYNRRALALREAAQAIVERHGGDVPRDLGALLALPGVGPYTARAVAASAFGVSVAPVDVNVRRVVGRLAGRSIAPRETQAVADALIAAAPDATSWVWAVMDLAATTCTRRRPRCEACPVAEVCSSRGTEGELPAPPRPTVRFESTNRWLRGRLVARLREADHGEWIEVAGSVGEHGPDAVERALAGLEVDGFIRRDGERARLA